MGSGGDRVRDFEHLLSGKHWIELLGTRDLDTERQMEITADELASLYRAEMVNMQIAFLRRYGANIPRTILPKNLAREVSLEEGFMSRPTTQILKTMGIKY